MKDIAPLKEVSSMKIRVPKAAMAAQPNNDDEALKARREEIRKRLLQGEKVVVDKKGEVKDPKDDNGGSIKVPPGKLAF